MEGIGIKENVYSIVRYEDAENIPKEVLIQYPAHNNIADLIRPEVYYFNTELRFEWKASWGYNDLPVLTIYYQDIIVQRIFNASADIVVVFLNEYKNIELSSIRERQVQTLWKENEMLRNIVDSKKLELERLQKINTEILAKIQSH